MIINTQVIPHTFRNKYLKNSGASTVMINGGNASGNTIINTGGSGGSISPHRLWGNVYDGTSDVNGTIIASSGVDASRINSKIVAVEDELKVAGKTSTTNITNSDTIITKNLNVTGKATFFELTLDKISSIGGNMMITPVEGFTIAYTNYYNYTYYIYWQAIDKEGKAITNDWMLGDQALCMNFNRAERNNSQFVNIENEYYWGLVVDSSKNAGPLPTIVGGSDYIDELLGIYNGGEHIYFHYIGLDDTYYDGVLNPQIGQHIVMCGNAVIGGDETRKSAIYIATSDTLDAEIKAPFIAQYRGIDDFNLSSHRTSFFDANGAEFHGNFKVDTDTGSVGVKDYIENKFNEGVTMYTHRRYSTFEPKTIQQLHQTSNIDGAEYTLVGIAIVPKNEAPIDDLGAWTWIRKGQAGQDGLTLYTWIKFADDANGTNMSDNGTGKAYIGFAYNQLTEEEDEDPTLYTWTRILGEKGDTGVAGPSGSDGKTLYTWLKYADAFTGSYPTTIYDTPKATTEYIGIAVNKSTPVESTVPTQYSWSKFKGDKGVKGDNGEDGENGYTVILSPSEFVFNTNDNGLVTFNSNNTTTVTVLEGTTDITSSCTFKAPTNKVNCAVSKHSTNNNVYVINSISTQTLSDNSTISCAAGSFDIEITANGITLKRTVTFIVNIAKFTGEMEITNKKFRTAFTELTGGEIGTKDYSSLIEQTARNISLSVMEDNMVTEDKLLATGIDITNKNITLTSDNFKIYNNKGEQTISVNQYGSLVANSPMKHYFSQDGSEIIIDPDQQAIYMRGGNNEGQIDMPIYPRIDNETGEWVINGVRTGWISRGWPSNPFDPEIKNGYWYDRYATQTELVSVNTGIQVQYITGCNFVLKNSEGYSAFGASMQFGANDGGLVIDGQGINAGRVYIDATDSSGVSTPSLMLEDLGNPGAYKELHVYDGKLYFNGKIIAVG